MQFMKAPLIFCPAKNRKIIGVFAFLVPDIHQQNQFPATLGRGQP
ncbi:replication protein RepA [Klebsiella pneumoniae]